VQASEEAIAMAERQALLDTAERELAEAKAQMAAEEAARVKEDGPSGLATVTEVAPGSLEMLDTAIVAQTNTEGNMQSADDALQASATEFDPNAKSLGGTRYSEDGEFADASFSGAGAESTPASPQSASASVDLGPSAGNGLPTSPQSASASMAEDAPSSSPKVGISASASDPASLDKLDETAEYEDDFDETQNMTQASELEESSPFEESTK